MPNDDFLWEPTHLADRDLEEFMPNFGLLVELARDIAAADAQTDEGEV